MYGAYQGSGQYGQYGPPGSMGAGPPGMAAPGTNFPPGMQQDAHQPRPGAFPPNFQPPMNMPNINFAAPVIRLGAASKGPDIPTQRDERDRGGRRAGIGAGAGFDRGERERPQQVQPQTREEIVKTIFVAGMPENMPDETIERILRAAGNLRRWFRGKDADDKLCKFGFAEYDDAESLSIAIEVLKDIKVPQYPPVKSEANGTSANHYDKFDLLVIADRNSSTYLEQWEDAQGGIDESHKQMLLDQAKEALQAVLADLEDPTKDQTVKTEQDPDQKTIDAGGNGQVVTIEFTADDELSDIPAEMRETVAKEIASFRDRSNRRDVERLKREEELEQQEKYRNRGPRGASPPASAPSGPSSTNGIPVGPRGVAPSGPKALAGGFARDYQKGVTFVNGTGINPSSAFDEDSEPSDSELDRKRREKTSARDEAKATEDERKLQLRERTRAAAIDRERHRDETDGERAKKIQEDMARRLRDWDDDAEALRGDEDYYRDNSAWIRNRNAFRQRETANDDVDHANEQRERQRETQQRERAGAMADDFLSRQGDELSRSRPRTANSDDSRREREQPRFKLSLGAAAQRVAQAQAAQQASKRTVAEVEGLLEDEQDADTTTKRKIVPIQFDRSNVKRMSEEERAEAKKQLAAEIPTDKEDIWAWKIKWEFVDDTLMEEKLKPFVEKKVVEYVGVQDEDVVDVVVAYLNEKKAPTDLVNDLEGLLEENAEVFVMKLWKMIIFFTESESRGLPDY